ncbi:MAG: TonB-dependent receptor [Opitutaceae bacterium]|nr:TonB-dependent receptor [Opitutaceae bacterium]
MNCRKPIALLLGLTALALTPGFAAETTGGPPARSATGMIEGRVFNPSTGEYVHYAEVRVQGTSILEVTGPDGRYRIANAPAGPVTLMVNHTGFQPVTATVEVAAGTATRRDFDLQGAAQPGVADVVQLGRFTVSGEREGTAKAIMEQRNSLNIKNVVASDTFSIMTEGNIGEVLQYLPGIQIRYTDGEPANPLMRGMAAKYGALQVDGLRMTGGGTRASELTSYSASATDTIEYSKTNSADMDADAPAGTINMKSKSAFQRRGRYFGWQLYSIVSSADSSLGKSPGPEDKENYKTLPSVALDFSDVYLDGKLGLVLNLSENNSILTSGFLNPTYDTTPTAYNPAPIVITQVIFGLNPKLVKRRGGALNLEYNLSPALTVALRGQIGWEDWRQPQRAVSLVSNRASQAPNASATAMLANPTANNATRFGIQGSHTNRTRLTYTFAPQVTYNQGPLNVEGSIGYTYLNSYTRNGRLEGDDPFFQTNYQLSGVGFTATRAYAGDTNFNFRQTSGPDLYTLSNWRATSLANNLVRTENEPTSKALLGQINARFTTGWSLPTTLKAGGKTQAGRFESINRTNSWTYVGPQNNRLTAEIPVSPGFTGVDPLDAGNIFDRAFQFPDRTALGRLQKTNPEWFVPNPTNATSTANLFPHRLAREYIDAAYVMATTQIGRLAIQEGVRYEATKTEGRVYERGVARTRRGSYDNFFLSASGRYRFQENLMVIAGFSQSIQRAALSSLAAVATVNDTTLTGTIPNPTLKPERGDNYSIRVEKYFEPAGVFSAGVFMFRMKDYHAQRSAIPAAEIGLAAEYPNYLFTTQDNAGDFATKGFELEYRQQLSMLPGVFKGLGVFANWTQVQSSDPELDYAGAPKFGSGGISFRYRRLNASCSGTWASEHNQNPTINHVRERTIISTNWSYQLTAKTSVFLTGRNIFNDPLYKTVRTQPGLHNQTLIQGSVWSFGLKGSF